MSARAASRNNVIAGTFVVVGVILAVAISVILSGVQERLVPSRHYIVRFTTEGGAAGLDTGSAVTVGGLKVGSVTRTRLAMEEGRTVGVEAVIRVRSDVRLDKATVAYLVQPILGGLAIINIAVPIPPESRGLLEPWEMIPGQIAPPAFLASAGYGPEQARQVQDMIRTAEETVDRIARMTARVEQDLDPDMALLRGTLEDARAAIAEIRSQVPEWTERVDSILAEADAGVGEFTGLGQDLRVRVEEARGIITDVQAFIDRNEASFDKIVADVSSVSGKLDAESVKLLNEALTSAAEGAEKFSSLATRAETLLAEESPALRRIVANFRLASDQIKLAAVEIRTKPWLLLYSPKTKELESEVLQQAVRTYADAVSDLRAASEALESATASDGSALALDRESVVQMTERIAEAFKMYQAAEQRLFDMLSASQR